MRNGFDMRSFNLTFRTGPSGISLAEVLVSIGIFSVACAGLYMAMQTMHISILTAMRRDIETAYVNMKIAEVNPNDIRIETAYDVTSKTAVTLPDGSQFFYTRIVDSATATPDVKNVNVYLYRSATATSPYRQVKREISPAFWGETLGGSTAFYKDSMGRVWSPSEASFSSTSGSRANGKTAAYSINEYSTTTSCPPGSMTGTPDPPLFRELHEASSTSIEYKLLGTLGRNYILRLGTIESAAGTTAGQRNMQVWVNGSQVDTMDAVGEAGATCKPLVKTYSVSPADNGAGLGVITVRLTQNSGATLPPRLAHIALERKEI